MNAGIDTISVSWSDVQVAGELRLAAAAREATRANTFASVGATVKRGSHGAVLLSAGNDVTVGTFSRSRDLVFIEGRAASILGHRDDPHLLTSWDDLRALPAAIARILRRLSLDPAVDDLPIDAALAAGVVEPRPMSELLVRRIDLALDLRCDASDPLCRSLLQHAGHAVLPGRRITSYEEEGRRSFGVSLAGRRALLGRIYDRALATGEPVERTVRLEAQRRWSGDLRPSLAEMLDAASASRWWHEVFDGWLPVAAGVHVRSVGVQSVMEAHRAGSITALQAERLLGTVVAMENGLTLWAPEGLRRRRARMVAVGVTASHAQELVEIDYPGLRTRIADAWLAATDGRRLTLELPI